MPSITSAKKRLCRSDTSTPTWNDRCWTRLRAAALGRYPSSPAAVRTASRRRLLTAVAPRMTRETSDLDTPARSATSLIVGGRERADLADSPSGSRPALDTDVPCIILAGRGTFPTILGTFQSNGRER